MFLTIWQETEMLFEMAAGSKSLAINKSKRSLDIGRKFIKKFMGNILGIISNKECLITAREIYSLHILYAPQ